ncbi:hypothetical protein [Ramlibacter sp. Leaf400]|uniref:hypothetical protein n=1 Tax=Ramlibacter sp. Leaf400 TaxID=1736365 RepID=UPI0006F7CC79|nr:hypothetical protein [Ramlibacter sp. Leaf400]KQT10971.1 hypothetical protein ASG30_09235 [Ramlibacter sp. Leaf400]
MKKSLILVALLVAAAAATAMPVETLQHFVQWVGAENIAALSLAGTTLATNSPRAYEIGSRNEFPVIAADMIYEGAAVGLVDASGHARPLANADRFAGFAEAKADNSAGSAADINVRVVESGKVQLAVTGAVITDVGQPVYASDDDTFSFNPAGGAFVGFVHRFVGAGVVVVAFDALKYRDPWGHYTVRETLSAIKTFDAEDCGKLFCVDADADDDALTLPAIADGLGGITILAVGAFGTTKVKISPAAADKIHGPDITSADDKDLILTKATQRRGDFVTLDLGDADGYVVTALRGSWAREA